MTNEIITIETHLESARNEVVKYAERTGRTANATTSGAVLICAVMISCTKALILAIGLTEQ